MARYVPFLSPIRLLVNLHKGLSNSKDFPHFLLLFYVISHVPFTVFFSHLHIITFFLFFEFAIVIYSQVIFNNARVDGTFMT